MTAATYVDTYSRPATQRRFARLDSQSADATWLYDPGACLTVAVCPSAPGEALRVIASAPGRPDIVLALNPAALRAALDHCEVY